MHSVTVMFIVSVATPACSEKYVGEFFDRAVKASFHSRTNLDDTSLMKMTLMQAGLPLRTRTKSGIASNLEKSSIGYRDSDLPGPSGKMPRDTSSKALKLPFAMKPPFWDEGWELMQQFRMLEPGKPGSAIGFADYMQGVKSGLEEEFMGVQNFEGISDGEQQSAAANSDFFGNLRSSYDSFGSVYKFKLGIVSAINVADPVMVRHILTNRGSYDKGLLSVVSSEVFGEGLITAADREVWKSRRKVVGPGFHKRWLTALTDQFVECTAKTFPALDAAAASGKTTNFEGIYLDVGLDIVGKAVFNFDFGSVVSKDSPVVSAVYRVLKGPESLQGNPFLMALTLAPPEYSSLIPGVQEYRDSLNKLNNVLDEVIEAARRAGTSELDIETLQQREPRGTDRSLLRFLLDVRGEDTSSARLKDDLRTLLIAGHETVASIMTWATYELTQNPRVMKKVRAELDAVLGDRDPTYDDVQQLQYLRLVITESLRLYPAPPFLSRRTLQDDFLPAGSQHGRVIPLKRGTVLFLNTAMMHRSPALYDRPDVFWPERWLKPFGPRKEVPDWKGYDPARGASGLGPNEQSSDYAFVPFGGGEFRCVGDQFAMIEAAVVLAMIIRRYDIVPVYSSFKDVGIDIAATIHTKAGLPLRISRRSRP